MLNNRKINPIVTKLFIRGGKLNTSLVFITQFYCAVPKNIRLNSKRYFIMKIANKRELQQIWFNHRSDVDFQDFINLCEECTEKPHSSLVIDTTLVLGNPSRFRKNLSERKLKFIMTIDNKTKDEKLQYHSEAAKILALLSRKTFKYEHLAGEKILPSNQSRILKQTKFTYFPLGKTF